MSEPIENGDSDLDAIVARIAPERQAEFLRTRIRLKKYHENDEILAIADYLATTVILVDGLTKNLSPRSQNAHDIQTAKAEVNQLTQAVRGVGEAITKLEARLKTLDKAVSVFQDVTRYQLFGLLAIVFMGGLLALPLIEMFVTWIRVLLHV